MVDINYDVDALKRNIEAAKNNIKTFEDAIKREEDTIRQYREYIRILEDKKDAQKGVTIDANGGVRKND
jgi:prefoldin subunit 5